MNEHLLILASLLVLVFGALSRLAERSVVTPPMVFMLTGLLLSPVGLGLLEFELDNQGVMLLAEIALVIILCSDASQVDRREIHKIRALPIRLLAIGLPLTMLLGAGVAALTFHDLGVPLAALALLAVLLSPTDAALGQAVINSEAVPEPVREALNVESGLNDGISLPPIFALMFVLGADLGDIPTDDWLRFAAQQIVFGALAGAIAGFFGGPTHRYRGRTRLGGPELPTPQLARHRDPRLRARRVDGGQRIHLGLHVGLHPGRSRTPPCARRCRTSAKPRGRCSR